MMYLQTILIFCLIFLQSFGSEVITLKGHLGKEELVKPIETIQKFKNEILVIEINSNTGDIREILNLAKEIYEIKIEKGVKIIVYIDDKAVGPAAIIPFLADQLYISFIMSWGDIPLGTEGIIPTNILRNRVESLIPSNHPHAKILKKMAAAMTDPSLEIHDEIETSEFQTLVVNHQQLQTLGLVSGVMSQKTFRAQFEVTEEVIEKIEEESPIAVKPATLDRLLREHIQVKEGKNIIGHIAIEDHSSQISQATWLYVKNALDYYKAIKPDFIILELNTPGGEVFASQKISDALKEMDTQYNIPVVAFINNWAISAGAMLAYSSRFITVVKDGSMGAAEPVILGEGGQMQTAAEKVNSALRADFANRASFFDRNPDLAEAMVDKDIILVWRFGKIVRLDDEEQIRKTGPNRDEIITGKGKLLTLNAEQLLKYGVADLLLLPKKLEQITPEEKEKGKWPAEKMLLFKYSYFKEIPNAIVDSYRMDWKTQFFVLISTPMASSILFLGMMLGFYMEFNTPGFGLPGTVGLTCLILIMLSSFALEIANILEVILLLIGIVMLTVELFVFPTGGILGFIGAVFALMGLFGMMLPGIGAVDFEYDTQTWNAAGEVFFERLAWLSATFVIGVIIIVLLARYVMPSVGTLNRFILKGHEQDASEGYVAGVDVSTLPEPGTKGIAATTLRPAGKIIINETYYDAITYGEFIDEETPIIIQSLDGSVIVVEKENP